MHVAQMYDMSMKKNSRLNLRLPLGDIRLLKKIAKRNKMTHSELVRGFIGAGICMAEAMHQDNQASNGKR